MGAGPESRFRAATLAARLLERRWFARAPIRLFRARLGFLTGSRLLLLEHIGRHSGSRRYVVLEVVDRPTPESYIVASGFGARAQWFRNVVANPSVRVTVGVHGPQTATARVLEPSEAQIALQAYARSHPRTWRSLRHVFESTLGDAIGEDGTGLPLVRLELTGEQSAIRSCAEPTGEARPARSSEPSQHRARRDEIPREGFEPSHRFRQRILSPPCLPFHHRGVAGQV